MRMLLARHGETRWNVEGRYQGQGHDIPLSPAGEAQARALGVRLGRQGFRPLRAVASPLARARQTAEAVLEACAPQLELMLDPGLRELSHGDWEGQLAGDVARRWPELQRDWRERPHETRPPGGERLQEVQARAWAALGRACQDLGPCDEVLVVSHDGVNRALLCRILGLPLARVWSFRQAATGFSLLEGDSLETLQVVRLNDAAHLVPLFGETVHRRL